MRAHGIRKYTDVRSIAIPDRVRDLDPAWHTCDPLFGGGFYDPPKTLHPGDQLIHTTAVSTTSDDRPINATPLPNLPQIPSSTVHPEQAPGRSTGVVKILETSVQDPIGTSQKPSTPKPGALITITLNPNPPPPKLSPGTDPSTEVRSGSLPGFIKAHPTPELSEKSDNHHSNLAEPTSASSNGDEVHPSLASEPSKALIIASRTFFADISHRLTIEGNTLTPGGTITIGASAFTFSDGRIAQIGGTRLILDSEGSRAFLGLSAILTLGPPPQAKTAGIEMVVRVLDHLFTILNDGALIIGVETIPPGSVAIFGESTSTAQNEHLTAIHRMTILFNSVAGEFVVNGTRTIALSDVLATAAPPEGVATTTLPFTALQVLSASTFARTYREIADATAVTTVGVAPAPSATLLPTNTIHGAGHSQQSMTKFGALFLVVLAICISSLYR